MEILFASTILLDVYPLVIDCHYSDESHWCGACVFFGVSRTCFRTNNRVYGDFRSQDVFYNVPVMCYVPIRIHFIIYHRRIHCLQVSSISFVSPKLCFEWFSERRAGWEFRLHFRFARCWDGIWIAIWRFSHLRQFLSWRIIISNVSRGFSQQ